MTRRQRTLWVLSFTIAVNVLVWGLIVTISLHTLTLIVAGVAVAAAGPALHVREAAR